MKFKSIFLLRLISGFLDVFPITLITILLTYIFCFNEESIKTIISVYIFFYVVISLIWIIPLSISQKKKKNLGYKVTRLMIVKQKKDDSIKLISLIIRNFFIIGFHNVYVIRIPVLLFIIGNIIYYFFSSKEKKSRLFIWDLFTKTKVQNHEINDRSYSV